MRSHHFSREEAMRRGQSFYERIQPQVEKEHRGEVVAIDLETGEYEIGSDTIEAARQLRARRPGAQAWFVRIGQEALYRFGSRVGAIPA